MCLNGNSSDLITRRTWASVSKNSLKRSKTSFIFSSPSGNYDMLGATVCYITGANACARWQLAGVSTNVSRDGPPDARQPWCFFLSPFLTFRHEIYGDTINAVRIWKILMELFLLFSRTDVAKEYRILRKWTKKMSKIRHRRNTFVQNSTYLYNKWAEGA